MKSSFFLFLAVSVAFLFSSCKGDSAELDKLKAEIAMNDSTMTVYNDSIGELNMIIDSLMALTAPKAKSSTKKKSSGSSTSTGSSTGSTGSTIQDRKNQMTGGTGDVSISDRKTQMQNQAQGEAKVKISDRKKLMQERLNKGQ